MSVPNQKIVIIKKPKYTDHFLQLGISEWQEAQSRMNYSTFCLYLYLAGNMNDFHLELSKEAFTNATGFKKTSYHDGLKKLQELGYLVHAQGNQWLFYTSPVRFGGTDRKTAQTVARSNGNQIPEKRPAQFAQTNDLVRSANIEIDNINKIDKIDTAAVSDREIQMYTVLDKLFPHNVYSAEDEKILSEVLVSECYWNVPQERIAQMTNDERRLMEEYYNKYYEYM